MTKPSIRVAEKHDFRLAGYFSSMAIIFAIIVTLFALYLLLNHPVVAILMLLIGLVIFTTHYRLSIDPLDRSYNDYVWILGLKSSDKGKFETIEYIYVNKSKVSQTMNHLTGSATLRKEMFDAYLKFSEDSKIHLFSKTDKKAAIKKLTEIATALNIRIIDYSDGMPTEIKSSVN